MQSKKDFGEISEQHWFETSVQNASSIQKVDSGDSIVAYHQDAADFFDSIDP